MSGYSNQHPYDDAVWMETFFHHNFNAHSSLAAFIQRADLESLLRDLRSHERDGDDVQKQLNEILKDETRAIVNLADALNALAIKIQEQAIPFFPLTEEITALHTLINTAETGYQTTLAQIRENNPTQSNPNIKIDVIFTSVFTENIVKSAVISKGGLMSLDRIVTKYLLQKSYVHQLDIVMQDVLEVMENVEDRLIRLMNMKFLRSFYTKNCETLKKLLWLYASLGKADTAQNVFRVEVVRPSLQRIFAEYALKRTDQSLDIIYAKVLEFMKLKMEIITKVVEENPALHTFNFSMNSFWIEFDELSCEWVPNLLDNPENFQNIFKDTYEILVNISKICESYEVVIHQNDTLEQHLVTFNLPYGLLTRYQQIVADFEMSLQVVDDNHYAEDNPISCRLKSTLALKTALSEGFAEDCYDDEYADQFVKLSILLLAGYLKYVDTTSQGGFFPSRERQVLFIMNSIFDLGIVESLMCHQDVNAAAPDNNVYRILDRPMAMLIPEISQKNHSSIVEIRKVLKNQVVKMKVEDVYDRLYLVTAVPTLYRRTNRDPPTQPGQYLHEALGRVTTFRDTFQYFAQDTLDEIMSSIILKTTEHYLTVVTAVLSSVFKTEESLKRLRSRNVLTTPLSPDETPQNQPPSPPPVVIGPDEIKMREQIRLDVEYFVEQLCPMCSVEARQVMDSLKAVV